MATTHASQRWTAVWMAVWGALAVFFAAWLGWRAGLPLEIDRNEAWNAWHAQRAFSRHALYPTPGDLIVNNYPPLSFVLLKALSFGGDPIFTGRLLSLVSIGVIGGCVGHVVRTLGAASEAAAIAGLWCVALFLGLFPGYAGMNDPNLPALAIMLVGTAVFVRRVRQGHSAWAGCAVMVAALFLKHTLVVFPLAVLAWQFRQDRAAALRSLAVMAGLGCAGLLTCLLVFGEAFFQQLLFPRTARLSSGFRFFRKLLPLLPALVLWWRWRRASGRTAATTFSTLAIGISLVLNFAQQCGMGVDYNATFEFTIACAIALGCCLGPMGKQARRAQPWLLCLLILFSNRLEPYLFVSSPAYRTAVQRQVAVLEAEVKRIRAGEGRLSCDVLTVCYRAGRDFEFDDFAMAQRVATSTWTQERLHDEISRRQLRFETIDKGVLWRGRTLDAAIQDVFGALLLYARR